MRSLIIGAALALGLGGCATNEDFGKIVGTISGAGLGSLVGGGSGKTVMTVVGGVAGYMVGGQLGRHMDQSDHDRAGRHLRRSFETPGTGTYNDTWSGVMVPTSIRG